MLGPRWQKVRRLCAFVGTPEHAACAHPFPHSNAHATCRASRRRLEERSAAQRARGGADLEDEVICAGERWAEKEDIVYASEAAQFG